MQEASLKIDDSLEQLVQLGIARGWVDQEEIIRLVPEPEENLDLLELVYETLTKAKITIIDELIDPTPYQIDTREAEFTELYKNKKYLVYSIAARILRDGNLAEEIVQEVFLTAWLHGRVTDSKKIIPWLVAVTRNKAIDMIRSQRRQEVTLEYIHYGYRIENFIIDHIDLSKAVSTLPPLQQQTLDLVYYQGIPVVDAASYLGESQNTIFSRKRLALHKLHEKLQPDII